MSFLRTRLGRTIAWLSVGCTLIATFALIGISVPQNTRYAELARKEVDQLIIQDFDHIAASVFNLIRSESEAAEAELSRGIRIAAHIIESGGGFSLGPGLQRWPALEQLDGRGLEVSLPRAYIGGAALEPVRDPSIRVEPIDTVSSLLGGSATIFQRMNERGDMLLVATSVLDTDGRRAVGSYLAAVDRKGVGNKVIETVLKGEVFLGNAFVVNSWNFAAYLPLRDDAGAIIGMLYVGLPYASMESRIRKAILPLRIGKTGYVFVASGQSDHNMRYVVSKDGGRDGEFLWDVQDSDGRYVSREIVAAASVLEPGQLATIRYRWQNPGEPEARTKIARLAYFRPWDWIIGASAYEDELESYRSVLESGRRRTVLAMSCASLAIAALIAFMALVLSSRATEPLVLVTKAAEAYLRDTDSAQAEEGEGRPAPRNEIQALSMAFQRMSQRIRSAMRQLAASEERYRGIYENAVEGIVRITLDGRLQAANPAAASLLGYASSAVAVDDLGRAEARLFAEPGDRRALGSETLEHGRSLGREVRLVRKDGGEFWASLNARLVSGPEGVPESIEGFMTDVSERRAAAERLRAALDEKDALLREVHHRVKNNMQILVSLVEMGLCHSDPIAAVAAYASLADRIRAMSRVFDALYESEGLARFSLADYALTLVQDLSQNHACGSGAVEMGIQAEDLELDLNHAVPCGLILCELVSNALCHAFGDDRSRGGRIEVGIHRKEGGFLELSVTDNGRGFDRTEARGGIGLRLVETLCAQIKATLEIERAGPRGGARCLITFPYDSTARGERTLRAESPARSLAEQARQRRDVGFVDHQNEYGYDGRDAR